MSMAKEVTYRRVALRRAGGRPYIGPKAQSAVPAEIFKAVEEEADGRGCPMSDIWRELIVEAWERRASAGGEA
jgi:hypothetical protein